MPVAGAIAVVAMGCVAVALPREAGAAGSATWSSEAPLAVGRQSHGAITLACPPPAAPVVPCGDVLVVGGRRQASGLAPTPLSSVELYDVAANAWSAGAPLPQPMAEPLLTALSSGNVLAVDGDGTPVADVYDPAKGVWTPTGPMGAGHLAPVAVPLATGKVLVAGAAATPATATPAGTTANAELYDPGTNTWSFAAQPPPASGIDLALQSATATVLDPENTADTHVLIAGGENSQGVTAAVEVYDAAAGSWAGTTPLGTARWKHTATLLPGGGVLVAGGDSGTGSGTELRSAEIYAAGAWTPTAAMTQARASASATAVAGGDVLIAGGESGGFPLFDAELYDPQAGTWTGSDMGAARTEHTATRLADGSVLVTGGCCDSAGNSLASVERFSLTAPPASTSTTSSSSWTADAGGQSSSDSPGSTDLSQAAAPLPSGEAGGAAGASSASTATSPALRTGLGGRAGVGSAVRYQSTVATSSASTTAQATSAAVTAPTGADLQPDQRFNRVRGIPETSQADLLSQRTVSELAVGLAVVSMIAWLAVRRGWWETAWERVATARDDPQTRWPSLGGLTRGVLDGARDLPSRTWRAVRGGRRPPEPVSGAAEQPRPPRR